MLFMVRIMRGRDFRCHVIWVGCVLGFRLARSILNVVYETDLAIIYTRGVVRDRQLINPALIRITNAYTLSNCPNSDLMNRGK